MENKKYYSVLEIKNDDRCNLHSEKIYMPELLTEEEARQKELELRFLSSMNYSDKQYELLCQSALPEFTLKLERTCHASLTMINTEELKDVIYGRYNDVDYTDIYLYDSYECNSRIRCLIESTDLKSIRESNKDSVLILDKCLSDDNVGCYGGDLIHLLFLDVLVDTEINIDDYKKKIYRDMVTNLKELYENYLNKNIYKLCEYNDYMLFKRRRW